MLMIASTAWNTDTMPGPNDVSAEAIDWLAGRIRWEHILRELHDRASGEPSVGAVDDITVALDALTTGTVSDVNNVNDVDRDRRRDEQGERAA